MICVAVAEDEPNTFDIIQNFLNRYASEQELEIRITHFSNGLEISDSYRPEYDIVLMDIDMPYMNGMAAAQRIREKDSGVIIVFITNLSQYAIQGYSVQAFDYILKPLSYFAFSQFFGRAAARLEKSAQKQYLTIHLKEGPRKIDTQDVYYIEIRNHTLYYHTSGGVFHATGKMKELETKLASQHFVRCNNGYLVNMAYVDRIEENDAIVHGEALPVSRSRKKDFSDALIDYISHHIS